MMPFSESGARVRPLRLRYWVGGSLNSGGRTARLDWFIGDAWGWTAGDSMGVIAHGRDAIWGVLQLTTVLLSLS